MKLIEYKLKFFDNREKSFKFQWSSEKNTFELDGDEPSQPPSWTDLDFNQCPNCPLDKKTSPQCPLAYSLVKIVKYFDSMKSFEKVFLEVKMDNKTISQETTVQKAVSGMMGLISAVSGCPHLSFFKPMAYFHLPLADKDSTIYRAASMYLLGKYFLSSEGKQTPPSLEGLKNLYKNIGIVNGSMAERLREASETDSAVNALVTLDIYAKTAPLYIEQSLSALKHLYNDYFDNSELLG